MCYQAIEDLLGYALRTGLIPEGTSSAFAPTAIAKALMRPPQSCLSIDRSISCVRI